jgi:hypothetical protein
MRLATGLCLLMASLALYSQTATFHEDTLHGRRAFVLENDRMRVSTLPGGGFIGEIRFKSPDPKKNVNPMRVPHYQTIDPYAYEIEKHGALYGTGMQRRLMSGYMGHFLCFPSFGASSPSEFALDYGQHGEALAVEWKQDKLETRKDGVTLVYSANLPKTQFRVERTITLPADETVGYVEESVENMTMFSRPVQWVQHITFGPPFVALNKTFVDASVAKTLVMGRDEERPGATQPAITASTWPESKDAQGRTVDQRVFSGRGGIWLLDKSKPKVWFTIYNADYNVLLGYIFPSAQNLWVLDWQENMRVTEKPWDGKVVARGICIGDSPFDGSGGLQGAVKTGSALDTPIFDWVQARERRSETYAFFLAEVPLGYKGVADLRIGDGKITITERETGKTISVKSARTF